MSQAGEQQASTSVLSNATPGECRTGQCLVLCCSLLLLLPAVLYVQRVGNCQSPTHTTTTITTTTTTSSPCRQLPQTVLLWRLVCVHAAVLCMLRACSGRAACHLIIYGNGYAGWQVGLCRASAHGRRTRESYGQPAGPAGPLFTAATLGQHSSAGTCPTACWEPAGWLTVLHLQRQPWKPPCRV